MLSVFYDLETSTRHFVGEILNYCFILCDHDFKPIDTLKGVIRLSRLEIPDPGALLANKVDLLEHQSQAKLLERQALPAIVEFLKNAVSCAKGAEVALVGFNSSKFDLPFLRTAFIRNALNPYFSSQLVSRDLRFVLRKLVVSHDQFPRCADNTNTTLSLRLEAVARELGLLNGEQSHESYQDVLLTIKLAKYCADKFALDVRKYIPFELDGVETATGQVYELIEPEYNLLESRRLLAKPVLLLDRDKNSSLWVDLERFAKGDGRASIYWFHRLNSNFIVGDRLKKMEHAASEVKQSFANLTLANYFKRSTCDIEQDIYRLDFNDRDALFKALWSKNTQDLRKLNNHDLNQLYRRHALKHYVWGTERDEKVWQYLAEYANYRYLDKPGVVRMNISKRGEDLLHPSIAQFYVSAKEGITESRVLQSWWEFCKNSDLARFFELDSLCSISKLALASNT